MINLQSYNEVLDFLELFFQKYILDSNDTALLVKALSSDEIKFLCD